MKAVTAVSEFEELLEKSAEEHGHIYMSSGIFYSIELICKRRKQNVK